MTNSSVDREKCGAGAHRLAALGLLVSLVAAAPAWAAERTFFFTGTVDSSGLDAVTAGTAFSGTYTVDDAEADTEISAQVGTYSTGRIFVAIDGVGTLTLDQAAVTTVSNDQPFGFPGFNIDRLAISAGEGSRSLSFTNAIQSAALELLIGLLGTPTTLTSDSLAAAVVVPLADWTDAQIVLGVSDSGDASCPPLISHCDVDLEIETLVEAFTLSVTKDGAGTGVVTSSPAGIDCGATCMADLGGTVVLTAVADAGSVFSGWTGCDSVAAGQCTVDVTFARSVNATFDVAAYSLNVTKSGGGSGTVTSTPTGIDCGATCAADFSGMVTLAASAEPGSVFAGWTGCDSVSADLCEVFVDQSRTVDAAFELEEQVLEVPTLSAWGVTLLALALAALGSLFLTRRIA